MEYFFVFFSLRCCPVEFVTMGRTNRGRRETRVVARGRRSSCPATASSSSSPLPQQRRVAVCTQPYFVFCTQPYFLLFCTLHLLSFANTRRFFFFFSSLKLVNWGFFSPKRAKNTNAYFFWYSTRQISTPSVFLFSKNRQISLLRSSKWPKLWRSLKVLLFRPDL